MLLPAVVLRARAPIPTAVFKVKRVDPDLVTHDQNGKAYAVRYEAVNAMLLNEFLKEHCTVQELNSTVAKQAATIAS